MELTTCTKRWFSNISHTITYDSWEQFMVFEPGICNTWKDLLLFTWGCKEEKDLFRLQLIYIDLDAKPNFLMKLPNTDSLGIDYIEKRCIEVKIKQDDLTKVTKWLLAHDPNFWNRDCLVSLQTHE